MCTSFLNPIDCSTATMAASRVWQRLLTIDMMK